VTPPRGCPPWPWPKADSGRGVARRRITIDAIGVRPRTVFRTAFALIVGPFSLAIVALRDQ
jgi:hypothetical protein